jgi:lysyl-tRNA synthetase class 2
MSREPAAWQPTATRATLQLRAQLLAWTRGFFAERRVLEVDTPALVRHAVTDPHLASAEVRLPGSSVPLFLSTSPEYAMKRLLAAGSGDIYQVSHVFRGEEASRLHNPEFTLIEWYRLGWSMQALMQECVELASGLLGLPAGSPFQALSYQAAFAQALGIDVLTAGSATLQRLAIEHGLRADLAARCARDELLDWLMVSAVGPALGRAQLCCLHRYPASQAALARLDPEDGRVALRFELYFQGVELANGFEELADAAEQRARFEADQRERHRRGLPERALDERLLKALEAGLPPVSGVALGFDRTLMLRVGAQTLSEVLPFPTEIA